ncbi:hypothetical protein [Streptomyces sp. NPDC059072]|uniref:hypothetical protein n=1 Tax=Streptomyces sp. NPDC059072 TaxID=3346715 RepID=UPI0036C97A32
MHSTARGSSAPPAGGRRQAAGGRQTVGLFSFRFWFSCTHVRYVQSAAPYFSRSYTVSC